MQDLQELEARIEAGIALLFLETADTVRVEEVFARLGPRFGRPMYRWSLATGLAALGGTPTTSATTKPGDTLQRILGMREPAFFLLFDLDRYLDDALVLSQLREIAARQDEVPHVLLIAGAGAVVPDALRGVSARLELRLPDAAEIEAIVLAEAARWGAARQRRVRATREAIAALVRNLTGLGHGEVRRLVRTSISDDGELKVDDALRLVGEKHRLLDQGGVLSFETKTIDPADVAGLATLKQWLAERKDIFLAPDPVPGLDPPKGVLLLGIQGGGKSLAAKSIAGAWQVPLLRLDFASLYNKYYGETERNLRESLRTAGAMAPCVLWIDEIEKGLASEGDDGGPGKRILGTLLTWMAERTEKVFLVATANDIESLPPELLRKGRFDEIFFVDLPSPAVRESIFAIHLRKRGQDVATFDLPALAAAAEGFSGAEIEQAVVAALYASRAAKTPLTTAMIVERVGATRPLSVVMAEKMAWLRAWASTRTVSAD
jgi:hypothetical protein